MAVEAAETLRYRIPSDNLVACFQLSWIPTEIVVSLLLIYMLAAREELARLPTAGSDNDNRHNSTSHYRQQSTSPSTGSSTSLLRVTELLRFHDQCHTLAVRMKSVLLSAPSHTILPQKSIKIIDEIQIKADSLTQTLNAQYAKVRDGNRGTGQGSLAFQESANFSPSFSSFPTRTHSIVPANFREQTAKPSVRTDKPSAKRARTVSRAPLTTPDRLRESATNAPAEDVAHTLSSSSGGPRQDRDDTMTRSRDSHAAATTGHHARVAATSWPLPLSSLSPSRIDEEIDSWMGLLGSVPVA
ncbi:hypothetical protein CBS101457_001324 [Exobasidium rhododendri]|nr:hypothetical protein CBS101457_001324 [Exobasidium rhododendri]